MPVERSDVLVAVREAHSITKTKGLDNALDFVKEKYRVFRNQITVENIGIDPLQAQTLIRQDLWPLRVVRARIEAMLSEIEKEDADAEKLINWDVIHPDSD